MDEYNRQLLDFVASRAGLSDDERPEVEVIQYVSLAETNAVLKQCLRDQGIEFEAGSDGGLTFEYSSADDEERTWLANYICAAQYPIDPNDTGPYTQEQKEIIADYMLDELVPCVEERGFSIEQVPSRSTFLALFTDDMGAGISPWYPTLANPPATIEGNEALQEGCPSNVPLERLYGE